jgi:hypothetical protein
VLLATLLYRSRLVPRAIPVLGLVGGTTLTVSSIAILFGAIDQVSVWGAIAAAPAFAWEIGLALWLIIKGFRLAPHGGSAADAPLAAVVGVGRPS